MPHPLPSVFHRLRSSYLSLSFLAAALGTSALVLLIHEFPGDTLSSGPLAASFLASSVIVAFFTVAITTMLSFQFRDYQTPTSEDFAVAWAPIAMADFALVEFVIGLLLWFIPRHSWWSLLFVGVHLGVLILIMAEITLWIRTSKKNIELQARNDDQI
ncbi:hypothetical protein CDEST_15485 [Colletotrichum destructivum]|uniref:Uncharacterized protein n=1 Tax=Colletotrichum destructivum TaxID=34406 RepID=A0AAX4J510_9PEZI|nr:hypothetical protein CDEST_15485 [Colletotrichum destructivum]